MRKRTISDGWLGALQEDPVLTENTRFAAHV